MMIERQFKPAMVALVFTGFLASSLLATADEILPPVQEGPVSGVKAETTVAQAPPVMQTPPVADKNGADSMAAYAQYTGLIKTHIEEALAAQKDLAQAQYRFVVDIWIARDGKVERAELEGSSGDQMTDELIRKALAGMEPIAEAPPVDMPQPVKLRITSKNAGDDSDKKAIHVQYLPESIKNQLREEIKLEVMAQAQAEGWATPGAMPSWANRIALDGDMRLRYERDMFPAGNESPLNLQAQGTTINNTSEDRTRLRVRARLGIRYKVSDSFSGGLRLVTGSTGDPVSSNQTLGGDYQTSSKFAFGLDRAYLKYKYAPHPWLSFSGGRMGNPWLYTDLVWDSDFAFDGVVAAMRPMIDENLTGFATLGAFPIQEVETNGLTVLAKSRWLYGAQAGFEWMSPSQSAFKLGLGYYDFTNIQGVLNDPGSTTQNLTARQFHQKGNTVFDITNPAGTPFTDLYGLASKFREVNLTATADFAAFDPVRVVLTGDYVRNAGFDASEVLALNPVSPVGGNKGWMTQLLVGMPQATQWNDWNVFAAYKYLETNAVLDAYTDSDFHLGGTNAKGWIVGGSYNVDRNAWLSLRWLSADEIVGDPLAIDVLMLDLNAKF